MQAVSLVKYGNSEEAFRIIDVDKPIIGSDQILIESEAFGLNFADVMARMKLYKAAPPIPAILGYDVVGKVVEVGNDAPKELLGKRVVAMTRFGGYAQFVKTSWKAAAVISYTADVGSCLALATQYVTAFYAAEVCLTAFQGQTAFVHSAAGGVGIALCQLLKSKGVTVIGKVSTDKKAKFLQDLGVDHVVIAEGNNYGKEVLKIANAGIDFIFNPLGGSTFVKDRELLKIGGKIVLYGAGERAGKKGGKLQTLRFALNFGFMSPIPWIIKSQGIIGVNMLAISDHNPEMLQHCLSSVVRYFEDGIIKPEVGGVFRVDQIAEAHDLLAGRKSVGKIIVKW